jgi:hypothetical protein
VTHPITPPPELVQQWREELVHDPTKPFAQAIADRAAQWGADQELEACCTELDEINCQKYWSKRLRAARRPKPISKAEALQIIDENIADSPGRIQFSLEEIKTIRRALEALPND